MRNVQRVQRILLLCAGLILLLPAQCSLAFTPMMLLGLFGPGEQFRDTTGYLPYALFFVPPGYAIALGGVRLLQAAVRGTRPATTPRWVLVFAGVLLLLPGLSGIHVIWEAVSRAWDGRPAPSDDALILLPILAPAFVAVGVYILARARRQRPATCGP
jgi:hypothetical protein